MWPYRVHCGRCSREVSMKPDLKTAGQVSYYKSHHYSSKKCTQLNLGSSKRGQKTICFDIPKRQKMNAREPYSEDEVQEVSSKEREMEIDPDLGDM